MSDLVSPSSPPAASAAFRPSLGEALPRRPIPLAVLGLALLSLSVLALLPFLQLGNGSNIPRFALFLGRFHPVVLHVPIGLLLFAIVLEHAHIRGLRRWIPKIAPGTSTFLIFFAALTATLSTILGWMLSFSGGYDPTLLHQHFLAGLATAVGANLALLLKLISDAYPSSRLAAFACQLVLLATGAALGLAGHWGASITHGEDYLTEYAPDSVRRLLHLPIRIDPADLPWKPLPERLAFSDIVGPILNDRCVSCHSGQKAQSGLRLDRYDLVLKGGNGGPAVLPGQPDKSPLLRYIDLPESDSKHMPPKGKTQVSEDERAILGWWVQAGAPAEKAIGELTVPPEVQLAMDRVIPEAVRRKQEAVAQAEAARLALAVRPLQASLAGSLRFIVPGQPGLEYSTSGSHTAPGDAELRQLEPIGSNLLLLNLAHSRVTDAGLASLRAMPNLTRLELQETNIDDAGLKALAGLTHLEVLNLYATHITDKGLGYLAPLAKLRTVYAWRTGVTEAGLAQLHKLHPRLEIVRGGSSPLAIASPAPAMSPKATLSPAK